MGNLERKQELIQEVMKLVKEFRKEESIVGTNGLEYIKFDDEQQVFIVKNADADDEEFALDELSNIFYHEIEYGMFYQELVSHMSAESYFKELTKKEFIEFVGGSYYARYRCTEIHERLKEIEKEFSEMEQ